MKWILCAMIIGVMFIPSANAQFEDYSLDIEENGYCINDSYVEFNGSIEIRGNAYPTHREVYCPHGCFDNVTKYGADCSDTPFNENIYVGIGVIIIFLIALFIMGGKRR